MVFIAVRRIAQLVRQSRGQLPQGGHLIVADSLALGFLKSFDRPEPHVAAILSSAASNPLKLSVEKTRTGPTTSSSEPIAEWIGMLNSISSRRKLRAIPKPANVPPTTPTSPSTKRAQPARLVACAPRIRAACKACTHSSRSSRALERICGSSIVLMTCSTISSRVATGAVGGILSSACSKAIV